MQVVALGAGDAHRVALDGRLHFEFAVLDQALDFFAQFALNAIAYLDHALDLVTTHFLHIAFVQKAHIDIAFGELVAQHVFYLVELKFRVAYQGDLFVLDVNRGSCAFEIKTGADFFGGVLHAVFHIDQIRFANGIKRGHFFNFSNKAERARRRAAHRADATIPPW